MCGKIIHISYTRIRNEVLVPSDLMIYIAISMMYKYMR